MTCLCRQHVLIRFLSFWPDSIAGLVVGLASILR
jgi:hypothetical protein